MKFFWIFAAAMLLAGCAGTEVLSNSVPGLDITGKKLWVLVNEDKEEPRYTHRLDSLIRLDAGKSNLQIEFVLNKGLALEPISIKSLFPQCAENYAMRLDISGKEKSSSSYSDGMGMTYGGSSSSVEYTAIMYDCNTQKIVWKMVVNTTGQPEWAQSEFVKAVFADWRENSILKGEK